MAKKSLDSRLFLCKILILPGMLTNEIKNTEREQVNTMNLIAEVEKQVLKYTGTKAEADYASVSDNRIYQNGKMDADMGEIRKISTANRGRNAAGV